MSDYKIFFTKDSKAGSYIACVPKADGSKDYRKRFHLDKYTSAKSAAILWRDKIGVQEWGRDQWDMILATKSVRRMRSLNNGLSVYKTTSGQAWDIWMVTWRDRGKRFSKCFSSKKYGTIENAEVQANLYAATIRAQLTGNKLNRVDFEFEDQG